MQHGPNDSFKPSLDISSLEPYVADAIKAAPKSGWETIEAYTARSGTIKNGWMVNLKVGHYGTDYLARTWLAAFGIPANAPKDAVYPVGLTDADGHNYIIRFKSKNDLPPALGGREEGQLGCFPLHRQLLRAASAVAEEEVDERLVRDLGSPARDA